MGYLGSVHTSLCCETGKKTMLSAGLASDGLSAENALLILHAVRPPLIIDPSSQALQWLRAHLKASDTTFEVVKMQDDRYEILNNWLNLQQLAKLKWNCMQCHVATNCHSVQACVSRYHHALMSIACLNVLQCCARSYIAPVHAVVCRCQSWTC